MDYVLIGVALVLIFFMFSKKKEDKESITESKDSKNTETLRWEESQKANGHYLYFSVIAEHLPDFDTVNKSNAESFPDLIQISWMTHDRDQMYTDKQIINIKNREISSTLLRYSAESEEELTSDSIDIDEALELFQKACSKAKVFITHAERYHRNILMAAFYKQGKNPPFSKSQVIDLMKLARQKEWTFEAKSTFNEIASYALTQTYSSIDREKRFKASEKVIIMPKIFHELNNTKT